eukprot:8308351-Pyramimonas_sp.AAC.1
MRPIGSKRRTPVTRRQCTGCSSGIVCRGRGRASFTVTRRPFSATCLFRRCEPRASASMYELGF